MSSERERIKALRKRETLPTGLTPMEQREALDGWERALDKAEGMHAAWDEVGEDAKIFHRERDEAREMVRRMHESVWSDEGMPVSLIDEAAALLREWYPERGNDDERG